METRKKGRRFVKEKSMRINLTIDKNNMELVDLCCAKRNMNVSELFRTFAREYATNVLKMDLNEFYSNLKVVNRNTTKIENESQEFEKLKEARRLRKAGDSND